MNPLHSKALDQMLRAAPVIPVLTLGSAEEGIALGSALEAGGLTVLEVTLRTGEALAALTAMRAALPRCRIGAGTVLDPAQLEAAVKAGAEFIVTPGASPALLAALRQCSVPVLPGAATASEMMTLRDAGFRHLKFFPAEQSGGLAALKAISAPLADLTFCPTGGIDLAKAKSYLSFSRVACVGGSWVAPADAVKRKDWAAVTALAKEAAALR